MRQLWREKRTAWEHKRLRRQYQQAEKRMLIAAERGHRRIRQAAILAARQQFRQQIGQERGL
jgi:hypothetical protein